MIGTYFRDVTTGRLERLSYLGHWLVLSIIGMLAFYAAMEYLGITEQMLSGIQSGNEIEFDLDIGITALLIGSTVCIALLFASMNIMAKRFRDMGLPGWLMVMGVAVLSGLLTTYASKTIAGSLGPVIFLLLILVPSRNG